MTPPDLVSFADLLDEFLRFDPVVAGADGLGGDVVVDRVRCELPFELEVGTGAAGPTQAVETSVMPVWHRLRFALERDDADGRE